MKTVDSKSFWSKGEEKKLENKWDKENYSKNNNDKKSLKQNKDE